MREHDFDSPSFASSRRKKRFDDDESPIQRRSPLTERKLSEIAEESLREEDLPPGGDRWTTWGQGQHGPDPLPDWLVTELGAVDRELGVLKTGKEADVHLLERVSPESGRSSLLAAKRYRSSEHRMFHRDAGYLEGRRVRRSREMRAMATRTTFGRDMIAQQWAVAEFAALSRLWLIGAPVPYPVQAVGTELLLEFLGNSDGAAAPRLAQLRPDEDELRDLWRQLVAALLTMAGQGLTHGDLSAYNLLVHDGRLMLIDLPQVVDIVANPQGRGFLERDVLRMCEWFRSRGMPADEADPAWLGELLLAEAGMS